MGNAFTIDRQMTQDAETAKAAAEAKAKLKNALTEIMDLATFQRKVISGEISDDKGTAELIINGSVSNYHIHIDRRCVTKSDGSLITYTGIMKMYKPEELKIKYTRKNKRMMSLAAYKKMMVERDRNQKK
jgi:hypothetical protein